MAKEETKRSVEKEKIKVLVYDTEKGETSRCFIAALNRQLGVFEFQDFYAANDEEKDTLSIIAVVRHASIRVKETLKEVEVQLEKEKVKDLERVFVIYFYVNKSDEGFEHKITQISESGQFNFATIVPINFILDSSLFNKFLCAVVYKWYPKTNNESLKKLKECILSRMKLCVNVYGAVDLLRVKAFIAELDQYISSSIELQAVEPLKEEINETSPTIICITGDECLEKIKEKDLKKVFLVHIIDVEKRPGRRAMHKSPDSTENASAIKEKQDLCSTLPVGARNNNAQNAENMPYEMYEILYFNGKFKIDFALVKQFETFVRKWPDEIKPSSENAEQNATVF